MTITIAYLLVLLGLAVLGAHRLQLLWLLARHRGDPPPRRRVGAWPTVTVQLPLYDEATVAARLLDAVAALDYPRDRLAVQVLDDSDDETVGVVAERVAAHRAAGLDVTHVRRGSRAGYKAGALAHGLALTRHDLVAIFDADFVPPPDFLRRTVPLFEGDPGLGLVQARWGHLNREASLLTRVQALALDAHFRVEQAARSRSGRFFNFNGTAGVFRRRAIEDAGGWASDTLTEDLDLSLRSQLCGWRFRYVDDVVVPCELPDTWSALRTQQRRWTRGSAQTARKLLGAVWRAPGVALAARVEATFQLVLNAAYPLLLLLALLSVPLVAAGRGAGLAALHAALVGFATLSVSAFYVASQRTPAEAVRAVLLLPAVFACGFGLSLTNGRAFLAGLLGPPAPFERTPKRGGAATPRYAAAGALGLGLLEALGCAYVVAGIGLAIGLERWPAVPFLLLVAAGFGYAGCAGLRQNAYPRAPSPLCNA